MKKVLLMVLVTSFLAAGSALACPDQPGMKCPAEQMSGDEMMPGCQGPECGRGPENAGPGREMKGESPLFAFLGLTPEQKEAVLELKDQERSDLRKINFQAEEIKDQLRIMERSDKVDMNAYEKKADQLSKLNSEAMVIRTKTRMAVKALLTEEQRAKMMAKASMKKHERKVK